MNKAVLIAAALVLAPLASLSQESGERKDRDAPYAGKGSEHAAPSERSEDLSQSSFSDRVAQAIETVENACAADIDDFCGKVTSGGGRVALCMLAHEDQLSGGCRSALSRAGRSLKRHVNRVGEACWSEIQATCGDAGKLGPCLGRKKATLSPACQTIVASAEQRVQERLPRVGMPVYGSDSKNLGQIVDVVRGPDDKVQAIQVDIGRMLGLGSKVVTITSDKLEQLPGIRVLLSDTEVRSLPEAKKQ
jgi:PRC-barrel domain